MNLEKKAENCVRSFHFSLSAWLARADPSTGSGHSAVKRIHRELPEGDNTHGPKDVSVMSFAIN